MEIRFANKSFESPEETILTFATLCVTTYNKRAFHKHEYYLSMESLAEETMAFVRFC